MEVGVEPAAAVEVVEVGLGGAAEFLEIWLRGWDRVGWDDGGMSGSSLATSAVAKNDSATAESARRFAPRRNVDSIMRLVMSEW